MIESRNCFTGRPALAMLAALVAASAAACSQGGGEKGSSPSLAPQIGQIAPDTYKPGQGYQLTKEEQGLDCKKLTGRMQVRILQARDASTRSTGSLAARTMQTAVTPVMGGTTRGASPSADNARDRAVLEAMNKQLAAKDCATFDLDNELQPRAMRDTPQPIPKAEPGTATGKGKAKVN
jgi:hypothetical protein